MELGVLVQECLIATGPLTGPDIFKGTRYLVGRFPRYLVQNRIARDEGTVGIHRSARKKRGRKKRGEEPKISTQCMLGPGIGGPKTCIGRSDR